MTYTIEQYEESAQAIRARLKGFVPKVAMVLGSGLGFWATRWRTPSPSTITTSPTLRRPPPPATRAAWCAACWTASGWR